MSVISAIVENVNDNLIASVLGQRPFNGATLYGLAYPYPSLDREDSLVKIIPAVINTDGVGLPVEFTNKSPLTIYHRASNAAVQVVQERAVGDNYVQRRTYECYLIACAWRPKIKMSADDLGDLLLVGITMSPNISIPAVKRCNILPSAIDLDFVKIFRAEFDKVNYFLKPEQILLQVRYQVRVDINPACAT